MQSPNAVTTLGLVLNEWMNQMRGAYPDMNMIYDEQLSVETALTNVRKKMERDRQAGKLKEGAREFPLLAFRRSPLKFPKFGMGRRSQVTRLYQTEVDTEGKQVQKPIFYKTIYGQLEVPFFMSVETLRDEEIFELEYMAEDRVSSVKELVVKIPDLGEFKYFASYSEIESKTVQSKDMYYKLVQGTVSFLGWYIVLEGRGSVITEIHAKVKQFSDQVLAEIDIFAGTGS